MLVGEAPRDSPEKGGGGDKSKIPHGGGVYQFGPRVPARYLFPPHRWRRLRNCRSTSKTCKPRGIASLSRAAVSRLFAASCKLTVQLSVFGQSQEELSCPRMIMRRPETAPAVER